LKHFEHPRETSKDVASDMLEVVQDFAISPSAICSDSATVMVAGMGKLNAGLVALERPPAKHVLCVCHQLNLVEKAMGKAAQMHAFRENLKKLAAIFNTPRMKLFLEKRGSDKTAMHTVSEIRWGTMRKPTIDFLDIFVHLQAYLEEHPNEEEARSLAQAQIDLVAFRDSATVLLPVLQKFDEFQRFFEGGRLGKIASYLQAMHEAKVVLQNAPEQFAEAAQLGIEKIDALRAKHWNIQGLLLSQATLLDPNTRAGAGNYLTFQERRLAEQSIRNEIELLSSADQPVEEEEERPALGTWAAATQVEVKPGHCSRLLRSPVTSAKSNHRKSTMNLCVLLGKS
jgi:hypothetical protein